MSQLLTIKGLINKREFALSLEINPANGLGLGQKKATAIAVAFNKQMGVNYPK